MLHKYLYLQYLRSKVDLVEQFQREANGEQNGMSFARVTVSAPTPINKYITMVPIRPSSPPSTRKSQQPLRIGENVLASSRPRVVGSINGQTDTNSSNLVLGNAVWQFK